MSPETRLAAEERITIDDLRHRAENVKAQAVAEARGAANTVLGESGTRTLVIVAGLVVVAASLAFFLGSRSGRAALSEEILGE